MVEGEDRAAVAQRIFVPAISVYITREVSQPLFIDPRSIHFRNSIISMPIVHVNLGPRSYDIEIGSGNLSEAAKLCDAEQDDAHTIIITDSNVGGALSRSGCRIA